MIACEVCGTRNEDKLTFCRTCGHRLKAKKKAAPPQPAATDDDDELDDVPARHSRPAAPDLDLDLAPAAAAPAEDGKAKCGQCGATSPKEYRFCISCGAVLRSAKKAAPSKPSVTQKPAAKPKPPRAKPKAEAAGTAKSRLGSLRKGKPSAPDAGESEGKPCASCDGVNDSEASFCKFCGAALGKAAAAPAPRPRSASSPLELGAKKAPFAPAKSLALDDDDLEVEPVEAPPPPPKPAPKATPAKPAKPAEKASGKLVVIVEDGSEGRALELRGRQLDIGSSEGDIVLSEDRYLSPRHARFFRQDGAWYLRDLSSVNGVYRRLRKPAPLKSSDLILLGLEVLEFEVVDHAERGLGHAIQHGVLVFGSPAALRRGRLKQRTVEGIVRDVYHLVADETTIGRETGDIVFTSDPFMSRRHAAIQWDEDTQEYVLVDLNSSNGTYLAIRDDVRLENGDFIRLGQHLFRVDLPS